VSTVLLVEDEPLYRDTLAKALTREGHRVAQAPSAWAAIRAGWAAPPQVLVADWMLRNHYHGVQIARALQVLNPELRTILITGFSSADLREELERLGGCELIEKPFPLRELHEAVSRAAAAARELPFARGGGVLDIGLLEVAGGRAVRFANRAARRLLGMGEEPLPDLAEVLREPLPGPEAAAGWVPATARRSRLALVLRARRDPAPGRQLLALCRADDAESREDPRLRLLLDLHEGGARGWGWSARVLVIDDEAAARRYSVQLLERAGCACFAAEDPELALRLLETDYGIHFVLLDLEDPTYATLTALRRIRELRPDVKLIGTRSRGDGASFAALGIDLFLRKPWTLEELSRVLDELASRPQRRQ
jgi:DNA-binding response OmpR family regulator